MQKSADFSKRLIKGRIAELIFDQMFRAVNGFTVIPFGYEKVLPELMQIAREAPQRDVLDTIKDAPDFALVYHSTKQVVLIEVKYRTRIDLAEIKEIASKIGERWKQAGLFVVTPEGFYLDHCDEIEGLSELTPLSTELVPEDIQNEFKVLVSDFYKSSAHAVARDAGGNHTSIPIQSA